MKSVSGNASGFSLYSVIQADIDSLQSHIVDLETRCSDRERELNEQQRHLCSLDRCMCSIDGCEYDGATAFYKFCKFQHPLFERSEESGL